MIDFEVGAELKEKIEWTRRMVDRHIVKLDALWPDPTAPMDRSLIEARKLLVPLQREVRARGLWGLHLDRELGGNGDGQVHYLHISEILGRTNWGSVVFGCQAPDSGNSEILARYGTPEQKRLFLKPLLDGSAYSAFSMTEPEGGADPRHFTCKATLEGDHYVINGEKWYTSHANHADFLIIMAVTDPDNRPYERSSMFIVPSESPGIEFIRETGVFTEPLGGRGGHPFMR